MKIEHFVSLRWETSHLDCLQNWLPDHPLSFFQKLLLKILHGAYNSFPWKSCWFLIVTDSSPSEPASQVSDLCSYTKSHIYKGPVLGLMFHHHFQVINNFQQGAHTFIFHGVLQTMWQACPAGPAEFILSFSLFL